MPLSGREENQQDAELVGLVFALTDALQHRYEQVAAEHGLTRQQATLLGLLEEPRPMSTLAEVLHRAASNVTGLVDRLEKAGLVQRERAADDRRVVLISTTAAGHDLHRRFEAALYRDDLPFTALTERERTSLAGLLRKLV